MNHQESQSRLAGATARLNAAENALMADGWTPREMGAILHGLNLDEAVEAAESAARIASVGANHG
jgi:hypothetical protein